jgi:hypothetical protein
MKKKIKKLVKILTILGCLLVVLLVAAYFVITKYYLPHYVQHDLFPQLAKRAGLKGFSGSIRQIGPTGADLGSLTIGPEDEPVLKVKSVRIDFSLNRLYSRHKLTITRAVFNQPELKCRIKNNDLYTGKITFKKFVTDLCRGLAPETGGQFTSELTAVEIIDGKLLLECDSRNFIIPYKMLMTPVDNDWQKILVKAVFDFPGSKIPLTAHFDISKNQVEFGIELDNEVKELVKAGKMLHMQFVPPVGKVAGAVKCKMWAKATVSPFKLMDYSVEGSFDNAIWFWRNFRFSSPELASEFNLRGDNKGFDFQVSQFNTSSSFEVKASEFTCTYRKKPTENFKFSSRIMLADKTLKLISDIQIKPIGKLMLERQITGSYKPDDESWEFQSKALGKSSAPGECAFKINDILTVAEVSDFALSGHGRGKTGKLDFKVNIPLLSAVTTITKKEIDQLDIKGEISFISGQKTLFENIRIKSDISLKQMILADNTATRHIDEAKVSSLIVYEKRKNDNVVKFSVKGKLERFLQSFRDNPQRIDVKQPRFDITLNGISNELNPLDISQSKFSLKATSLVWNSQNLKIDCSEPALINDRPRPGSKDSTERGVIGSFGRIGIVSGKHRLEFWLGKLFLKPPENGGETQLYLDYGKIAYNNGKNLKIATGSGLAEVSTQIDMMLTGTPDKALLKMETSNIDIQHLSNFLKLDEAKLQIGLEFDPTMDPLDGLKLVDLKVKSDEFTGNRGIDKLESTKFTSSSLIKFKPQVASGASLLSAITISNIIQPTVEGEFILCGAKKLAVSHRYQTLSGGKSQQTIGFDFIEASINSQSIALAQADGNLRFIIPDNNKISGNIELKKANLSLPKYKLVLKKLFLKTPFSWPLVNTNGDGAFTADVSWRKFGLGKGNFDLSIHDRSLLLRGVFSKFPAPGGRGLCFGRAKLTNDENFKLEMDLSIPEQNLIKPFNFGLYFPYLDGISMTGKARAAFSIEADIDGISRREAVFTLNNANLNIFNHQFKQVSTICKFEDFLKLQSKSHQPLRFGQLNIGPLKLQNGSCKYQLLIPGGMDISECKAQWFGAKSVIKPFKLDESNHGKLHLSCTGVYGTRLLKFIGFTYPDCPAKFNGSFDFSRKNGKYLYSKARFQTIPGSGYSIKLPDLKHLVSLSSTASSEALAAAALADFKPNWIKIDFTGPINNAFDIKISTNGRPAAPLPFVPVSGGNFTRASSNALNAVSGEMELQLELSRTAKK